MMVHEKLFMLTAKHRLSQRDLAKAMPGISTTTINRWLNGETEPRLRDALKLCRVLSVPLEYLADDSLDEPLPPDITEDEEFMLTVIRKADVTSDELVSLLMARRNAEVAEQTSSVRGVGKVIATRDETEAHIRRERERNRPKKVEPRGGKKGTESKK